MLTDDQKKQKMLALYRAYKVEVTNAVQKKLEILTAFRKQHDAKKIETLQIKITNLAKEKQNAING
jgi:hypothetical protein